MSQQLSDGSPREESLRKLRRVSTATLATQLFKRGLRQQFLVGVGPVGPATSFVGEAFTMRFIPAREDIDTLESLRGPDNLQWRAIESLQPGYVLVVDSREDKRAASAGDMLVTRAMKRGAVAFVTDGAVRDAHAISRIELPTYAQCATAGTRLSYFHVADLQTPIGCAGVPVYPGDVLVGDSDGVITVPRELTDEIAADASEQEELEEYLHSRVRAGEPLWGVYPPDEDTMAKYRRTRGQDLSESAVAAQSEGTR